MYTRNERKPSTSRRMTFMILGVGGFLALLIGWNMLGKYFAGQAALNMTIPPQTVTSIQVVSEPWQVEPGRTECR